MRGFPIMIVLVLLGSLALPVAADPGPRPVKPKIEPVLEGIIPNELREPLPDGEAVIWYLLHDGYAVKTKTKLLIFDYVRGLWLNEVEPPAPSIANGWINPEEISSLDVYVFVTHPHGDHYDPIITEWRKTVRNIRYFFGWPASESTGPQTTDACGSASDVDGQVHYMTGPRASFVDNDIAVYTINSHHSGVSEVAYLVKTDSLAFYHGGDYNAEYKADMRYLKTKVSGLDFAIVNDWCGPPILEVLEVLTPKLVFPAHFGGKEHEPRRLPACCQERGLPCIVKCPLERGQMFRYGNLSE